LPPSALRGRTPAGARSFRPAVEKLKEWLDGYWSRIVDGAMPCTGCGEMVPILTTLPDDVPWALRGGRSSMFRRCTRCGTAAHSSLDGRVLDTPEGRRFHREHPRIRTLPERRVEADGRPAVVTAFESVTGSAVFEAVTDLTTLRTVVVRGAPTTNASISPISTARADAPG
jgi:hypothetical protein